MEQGLQGVAEPIADFLEGIFDRGELVRENRRLSEDNERLLSELARLQDAEQRYDELLQLLEVEKGRPQDEFAVANVIAREPSNLRKAIAIDRGVNDGVVEGLPVIAEGGSLVGTVSRAYDDFAWVTLLSDPDSVVNVRVQKADASGLVSGDLRRGLMLDMVPSSAPLEPGLLVTTSGLGGNYPQGFLIGTIESVDNKPQALFQKAVLAPASDLSGLETVLVLTSFTPTRLQAP
jgi:rod shape-determining protein MreC